MKLKIVFQIKSYILILKSGNKNYNNEIGRKIMMKK